MVQLVNNTFYLKLTMNADYSYSSKTYDSNDSLILSSSGVYSISGDYITFTDTGNNSEVYLIESATATSMTLIRDQNNDGIYSNSSNLVYKCTK